MSHHHHQYNPCCCGSCDVGHHHHHHQGNYRGCCCCVDHHYHHHVVEKDFAHQLLEMADEAWMEILKDKIKEQILSSSSAQLDELAKIVSQSNGDRWKHKIATNAVVSEYRNKFASFFDKT